MNVLIVDDSRLARKELRQMLSDFKDLEIVGEAANADEARELIHIKDPDLVLLDIQMPGEDGFELLESLPSVPKVIFTTAFDEYAVQAFEKNALDYLMKPIEADRLEKALRKARNALKNQQPQTAQKSLLGPEDTVFVKDGERCEFITLNNIQYIETLGNYAQIHFNTDKILLKKSLNAIEDSLSPRYFFRANRQVIVNIKSIQKVDPWFNGGYRIELADNQTFDVSRRQASKMNELLSF